MFKLYEMMWDAYQKKEISEKVWLAFVDEYFEKYLEDNEEVLIRLKNI